MIWYLTYRDAPNPRGIPTARPADYSPNEQQPPWVETDQAGFAAVLASTAAAYATWRTANPVDTTRAASSMTGEDDTRWKIDRTGNLVPA